MSEPVTAAPRAWPTEADCRLDELAAVLAERTDPAQYPHAEHVVDEVLVYRAERLRAAVASASPNGRRQVQAELAAALADGPGIVMFRGAFDPVAVRKVTAAFEVLIDEQRAAGSGGGDHFAPPGANDRVWNALEKLAVRDPNAFVDYYANDLLALVATAWLGPGYQVTSQLNRVNPGGKAQVGHRDYHLGFLPNALIERFPAHVHRLSPVLTLQGAVAHCDMPLASGPTEYLPHSQRYPLGYLAMNLPEFRAHFESHHVQLPLELGDAVFFNPAVIHAAGHNRTADVRRMANLLQISSAFGRAMESVDRQRVCTSLFPVLRARRAAGAEPAALDNVVAAAAEGYPFPTNLDLDPPVDGLAPPSQADLLRRALHEGRDAAWLDAQLAAHTAKRRTT